MDRKSNTGSRSCSYANPNTNADTNANPNTDPNTDPNTGSVESR